MRFAPSPLMLGMNLPDNDDWTTALLTNPEVLAVNQKSTGSHPLMPDEKSVVWIAETPTHDAFYVAAFNRTEAAMDVSYSWKELGLNDAEYAERDLWAHKNLTAAKNFAVKLPAHGCVLYRLKVAGSTGKP